MKKLAILLILGTFLGAGVVLLRVSPLRSKERVTDIDPKYLFRPRLGSAIPTDTTFRDETGRAVTLGDYGGERPYILVPAYYRCPSLCNEVLNELVKGLRGIASYEVGKDYDVVVVSFDARETPELAKAKKAAYVDEYRREGSEQGWHFLTGEQPQIDRLLESIGYRVQWDEGKQQFLHASGIVLCTPQGIVARYFPGLDYRPLYLRLALTEAGRGTISAGIIDQVLLPCFAFDESKGQYSASVLTLVRAAGVATLVAVVLFWVVMWRRGRAAPRTEIGAAHEVSGC
jgi:protein SCO1/2